MKKFVHMMIFLDKITKFAKGCIQISCLIFLYEFVSGSILVACAHFGAYVSGTDIDYKLLMGRGEVITGSHKVT